MYSIGLLSDRLDNDEERVIRILKDIDKRNYSNAIKKSEDAARILTSIADSDSEERVLNAVYILTTFYNLLRNVSLYWRHIESDLYHQSWCALQDGLDNLRSLKKFYPKEARALTFFEKQLIELESLYPYTLFSSPGFIVDRFECSICGNDIDSDSCPHMKGELYFGDIAYAVARDIKQIDHLAIVTNPANKRLVIGCDDSHSQFNIFKKAVVHFNRKDISPLGFSEVKKYDLIMRDPKWVKLPRNSKCYCGSGIKYKKCCISESGIRHVHVDFVGNHIFS